MDSGWAGGGMSCFIIKYFFTDIYYITDSSVCGLVCACMCVSVSVCMRAYACVFTAKGYLYEPALNNEHTMHSGVPLLKLGRANS